jgi:hypothetical protein
MAITYEPIATETLGSNETEIEFASISGAWTDLVLVVDQIQTTNTGSSYNALRMRVNSDTGTNYSFTSIEGDGSTPTSNRDDNDFMYVGFAPQTSATTKAQLISHFMNYSNTTTYKTVLHRANAAAFGTQARVHIWRNTAAITNIKIVFDGTVQYKAGMSASLYGIKAA